MGSFVDLDKSSANIFSLLAADVIMARDAS
jgi:hypothetical protein